MAHAARFRAMAAVPLAILVAACSALLGGPDLPVPDDGGGTSESGSGGGSGSGGSSGGHEGGGSSGGDSGGACVIGGASYGGGAANPANACQSCQSSVSTSAWSNVADGTACGTGEICHAGACGPGCEIGGTYYAASAVDPNNPCQTCQPTTSTSAWGNVAVGTGCGNGQVCASGNCGTQCDIGGTVVPSGAANPSNACQSCQPGTSTTAWSNLSNGTSCGPGEDGGPGQVCNTGMCSQCAPGQTNPIACGNCGTDTQTCGPTGTWQDGTCEGEGACAPNATMTCNAYGTETCTQACAWSACSCPEAPACTPGATCRSGCNILTCDTCGQYSASCGGTCTTTFTYTGAAQTFVVPADITQITITAAGAAGSADCYGTAGGEGASVTATLTVTGGDTVTIYVGGAGGKPNGGGYCQTGGSGGFNGGGQGGSTNFYGGGGGGGASDIRIGGSALGNRVVVAAGGGGGGGGPASNAGGAGGTSTGAGGGNGTAGATGGGGGSQSAGGPGGAASSEGSAGFAGASGTGGVGGSGSPEGDGGGGGGGGYYGGGGGGGNGNPSGNGGGGGGGSSYASSAATGVTMTAGTQAGNGQVVITY